MTSVANPDPEVRSSVNVKNAFLYTSLPSKELESNCFRNDLGSSGNNVIIIIIIIINLKYRTAVTICALETWFVSGI